MVHRTLQSSCIGAKSHHQLLNFYKNLIPLKPASLKDLQSLKRFCSETSQEFYDYLLRDGESEGRKEQSSTDSEEESE